MDENADSGERWDPTNKDRAYVELDHPADIFLEVYGGDLPTLFENALFALYDQLAELEGFELVSRREQRRRRSR
jgi:SHS2 domain-containing protein